MTETNAWYVRQGRLSPDLLEVSCFRSDRHDDGVVVPDAGDTAGLPLLWRTSSSDVGLLTVSLAPDAAPGSPDLWFVWVDEPKASTPATNLVAFATDRFAPGTVVSNHTFASLGVPNEQQAAAVRWYPASGVVHQIYVAERWRRLHVGTALIYTASALHQAKAWPGRLHSDGRRTDIGERFTAGLRHPRRIAARDADMPPMDA